MIFHCTLVQDTLVQDTPVQGSLRRSTFEPGSTRVASSSSWPSEVPDTCPGADLEAAIGRRYATGRLFVRAPRVAALTVGTAPLVPGAVLVR